MKKIGQKIILSILFIIGIVLTYGLTLYTIIDNLIIGQDMKVIYSISSAVILFFIFIIVSRWLLVKYERKLQAIAVAEEMNVVPSTNFIIVRILKQLEIMLPIGIMGIMLYGMTLIEKPSYIIFRDIILWMGLGLIILLIHDGLKVYFMNVNKVKDAVVLDEKKHKFIEKQFRTTHKRGKR